MSYYMPILTKSDRQSSITSVDKLDRERWYVIPHLLKISYG
jgi:hypothetical protein